MKVVILAGGMGTRIEEESKSKPKPMIEIGGRPILWHIMKHYAAYGHTEFIICCGYKGHMIKEYFLDYYMRYSNVEFDLNKGSWRYIDSQIEPWTVTMVNTGLSTNTAGRVLGVRDYLGDEPFMLTYGDGVSDIDIDQLLQFHREKKKKLTITVTRPEGRFGVVDIEDGSDRIRGFQEKRRSDQGYVNAGFMVCEPEIFDYLGDGSEMLEQGPFGRLVEAGEMAGYRLDGFWSPMDNIKDKKYLEGLWQSGQAPWL